MTARTAAVFVLPSRIAVLHAMADAVESAIAVFDRWNDRRRTVSALRKLSGQQLSDIGLAQADLAEVAARMRR